MEDFNRVTYKRIKEFPVYYISAYGSVYNSSTKRYLKNRFKNSGYLAVVLYHNSSKKEVSVHRLVAGMFLPNPESKPQINHKDGDKTNNQVSNLEWCTSKENVNHALSNGLREPMAETNRRTKSKLSTWFHERHGFVKASAADMEKDYYLDHSHLSKLRLGKTKSHKGWTYKGE